MVRIDEDHLAQRAGVDRLPHDVVARQVPAPHRLGRQQASGPRRRENLLRLSQAAGEGLLDEHRFAGPQGEECMLVVGAVRTRHVHRLHVGVGDEVLVGPVRPGDPVSPRELLGPLDRARAHSDDAGGGRLAHGIRERVGDAAGTDHPHLTGGAVAGSGAIGAASARGADGIRRAYCRTPTERDARARCVRPDTARRTWHVARHPRPRPAWVRSGSSPPPSGHRGSPRCRRPAPCG